MIKYLLRTQFILLLISYFIFCVIKFPPAVTANNMDLVFHGAGYFILILSGLLVFPEKKHSLKLFLCLFLYSFLIECVQYFLPHRSFALSDILANGSGLLVGLLAGRAVMIPLLWRLKLGSFIFGEK